LELVPLAFLYVQAGSPLGGDGSEGKPFATIQAATAIAKPGTAVLVRAGTYIEAVKLPSRAGGTATRPIWYVSAGGAGKAKIVVPKGAKAGIQGLGVKNIAIVGFEIVGGENGVQFSMSGDPRRNPAIWHEPAAYVQNVVVRGNILHGQAPGDGVKISQADGVEVSDNVIYDVADQCVDFVAVNDGTIARNDCSGARHAAGIFAKAGSRDIRVSANFVHDFPKSNVAGIALGGESTPAYFRPNQNDFEVLRMQVRDNRVEKIAGYPILVQGAKDSTVAENILDSSQTKAAAIIGVTHGSTSPVLLSPRGISIEKNILKGPVRELAVDRATRPDGEPRIDLRRDEIKVSDNTRGNESHRRSGPEPFQLWNGSVTFSSR
jgi:serralysin